MASDTRQPTPTPAEPGPTLGRICESNSLECSGTVPCGKCYYLVLTHVIPGAMRAGGFAKDQSQANAFLRAYTGGWKKLLEEKVAEKKAGNPSSFEAPPQLLEFFAYRESARESARVSTSRQQTAGQQAAVVEPGPKPKNSRRVRSKSKKKKGTNPKNPAELLRGDLKRMVEREAKEPLANGTSSGISQSETSKPGTSRDEEKH